MARRPDTHQLHFLIRWVSTSPPHPPVPPELFEAHARLLRFYAERRAARLGIGFREALRWAVRRHGPEPTADPPGEE